MDSVAGKANSQVGAAVLAVVAVGLSLARDTLAWQSPSLAFGILVAGYVVLGLCTVATCFALRISRAELGLGGVSLRTRVVGCLVLSVVFALPALGRRAIEPHLSVVLLTLVAAPAEELVCRGALFALLSRGQPAVVAPVVTALVFAAMHAAVYAPPALALAAIAGLVFGAWRALTADLVAPVAGHLAADLAAAVVT